MFFLRSKRIKQLMLQSNYSVCALRMVQQTILRENLNLKNMFAQKCFQWNVLVVPFFDIWWKWLSGEWAKIHTIELTRFDAFLYTFLARVIKPSLEAINIELLYIYVVYIFDNKLWISVDVLPVWDRCGERCRMMTFGSQTYFTEIILRVCYEFIYKAWKFNLLLLSNRRCGEYKIWPRWL